VWVGTQAGLYRSREPDACRPESCVPHFQLVPNEAIPEMPVRVLYQDREGALWVGASLEGLARYQDGRFTTYTARDGLSNGAVRALVQDREGALWIGTKGGLHRMKDGKFTVYREKDGLPSESVQALYLDPQDTLWIATRHGLARLKDGRFTGYTVKDGLYAGHVYGFVEDDVGNLWMSCGKGIFRVRKQELDDFAEGRILAINSVAYGRGHGLPSPSPVCAAAS
jgi:ligand-binding sensor domain-containing protein